MKSITLGYHPTFDSLKIEEAILCVEHAINSLVNFHQQNLLPEANLRVLLSWLEDSLMELHRLDQTIWNGQATQLGLDE